MKKLLSAMIVLSLLLASAMPVFAAGYTDIKNSPAKAAIEKLSSMGVLEGYGDGTFHPEKNISRAEMVKVILLTLKEKITEKTTQTQFDDVDPDVWYAAYVQRAVKKGIIEGKSPVIFDPKGNVTYDQAVTMVVRAMGFSESKLKGSYPECFTDKAEEMGILKGLTKGSAPASREHVAQLMVNMMDWAENNNSMEGIKLISSDEPAIIYNYAEVADRQYKIYTLQSGRVVTYNCEEDALPAKEDLNSTIWSLKLRNSVVTKVEPFAFNESKGTFVTAVTPTDAAIQVSTDTGVVRVSDEDTNKYLTCDTNAVVYIFDANESDADKAWTVKPLSYLNGIKNTLKDTIRKIVFMDTVEESSKPYEEYNYIVVIKESKE